MSKSLLVVGMFALAFLAASGRAEPLSDHFMNAIVVNLDDDLPVRLPIQTDLSRFERKPIPCTKKDCYDCCPLDLPFRDRQPFSIALHQDIESAGDFFMSFDNCFGPDYGRHRRQTDAEILKWWVEAAARR